MSGLNPIDVVEEDAADLLFPKELFAPQTDPFRSFACDKCKSVLIEPFVSCVECQQLFCLSCFSRGLETELHKNNHAYTIRNDEMPLFPTSSWTAREEKKFLDLVQSFGVGNWDEISSVLKRTPEQCQKHFYSFYFDGIFDQKLGLTSKNAYSRLNIPFLLKPNSLEPPRNKIVDASCDAMSGYRFARSEFDVPYDNSAESLLNNITLDGDNGDFEENPEIKDVIDELNCAVYRAYNHRLKERMRRYKVIRDHGLILQRKTLAWLSKYSDVLQNQSNGQFITFMQITDGMTFDFLVESLKYFHDTKRYLYRLYELRQNGIKSLAGGKLYFKLRAKRTNKVRDKRWDQYETMIDWKKLIQSESSSHLIPIVSDVIVPPVPSRKKATPLDVIGLPGYDQLTEDEKSICSETRLTPLAFLEYKRILIAENGHIGYLRLSDARRLIKIDVNKTRQIYDFLVKNGYVNAPLT